MFGYILLTPQVIGFAVSRAKETEGAAPPPPPPARCPLPSPAMPSMGSW